LFAINFGACFGELVVETLLHHYSPWLIHFLMSAIRVREFRHIRHRLPTPPSNRQRQSAAKLRLTLAKRPRTWDDASSSSLSISSTLFLCKPTARRMACCTLLKLTPDFSLPEKYSVAIVGKRSRMRW